MSTTVTMSQTVNELTSGSTYIVRSKEAEKLVADSNATKTGKRGNNAGVLPAKTGKRGN